MSLASFLFRPETMWRDWRITSQKICIRSTAKRPLMACFGDLILPTCAVCDCVFTNARLDKSSIFQSHTKTAIGGQCASPKNAVGYELSSTIASQHASFFIWQGLSRLDRKPFLSLVLGVVSKTVFDARTVLKMKLDLMVTSICQWATFCVLFGLVSKCTGNSNCEGVIWHKADYSLLSAWLHTPWR